MWPTLHMVNVSWYQAVLLPPVVLTMADWRRRGGEEPSATSEVVCTNTW